ncbi:MAG: ABC transporter substrate-binding protein [Bacteroidales bacterium]|nr:ABC transporter substrate-binding protein [Bacteroidales bacterium]
MKNFGKLNEAVLSSEIKNKWGGIVPGHALDGNSFVLWCNQEVAEKIGIKVKQFDISTEDFEGYLKAVKEFNQKNNKQINSIYFNDGWLPTYALGLQVFSSLVGDYDKLKDPGYKEAKIEAWEKTLKYFERLTDFEPLDPQWSKIQYGSDYNRILNGECLFMVNGTWMYNIWQDMDSVNYKKMIPLELPGMQPSKTYIGEVSIPWTVPLNAKNREQAVKFMLYWCRPEVADEWVRNTKVRQG